MQIIVTNKVRIRKRKPGEIREKFKSRAAFENWKAAQMLFVKGGTTEETSNVSLMWSIAQERRWKFGNKLSLLTDCLSL